MRVNYRCDGKKESHSPYYTVIRHNTAYTGNEGYQSIIALLKYVVL